MICNYKYCREIALYGVFCPEHSAQKSILQQEIDRLRVLQEILLCARRCDPTSRFGDTKIANKIDQISMDLALYIECLKVFNE